MAAEIRGLFWGSGLLLGWLALTYLAGGWYAGRRFRALLKAPLTEEVEHQTHVWEGRVKRWTFLGGSLAGVSILCLIIWLASERFIP